MTQLKFVHRYKETENKNPTISIIAPNLNEAKFLPTFLKSLLHQTFTDFEVIIIDGGSTDESLDIIQSAQKIFQRRGINLHVLSELKPNIGYVRNIGSKEARGRIFFCCNTDNYFEPNLFKKIIKQYNADPSLMSISGRVFPIESKPIANISYQLFDLARYLFTRLPIPFKKYCPSGNFCTVRDVLFFDVGGYPEEQINEDGLFGLKITNYPVKFDWSLYVGHYAKKFEQMGGLRSVLFYLYVLGNFFTPLRPLLEPIRYQSAAIFSRRMN